MRKTMIALASVVALGAGFASQANAGDDCMGTVAAVCDWLYPSDTTVETEQNYTGCMVAGGKLCSVDQGDRVVASNLKTLVQQSPKPDNMTFKKYARSGWQTSKR